MNPAGQTGGVQSSNTAHRNNPAGRVLIKTAIGDGDLISVRFGPLCGLKSGSSDVREVPEPVIQEGQNSFKSLAMSTGPEKCFFTSSTQVE
jgi:hypothetical protein